ncbi:MAG: VOC family protein [Cryomorphaceae bacterium]|nr:VOC family protein [Cryomorphaceae bacterium]
MNQAIQPYLHFNDNCKEVMQFYQSIFGGELEIMTVSDSPAKEHFPEEVHHHTLHASLSNGDFGIMASYMCGQGEVVAGNNVQLSLNCKTEEEINTLFRQLSQGGKIMSELKEEFWGGLFGMVVDKYGTRWMLSYEK